jgi:hypothetical protein
LGKTLVFRLAVDANAEDLGLGFFEEDETILVRLDFVRSSGSVGENVERQDHVLSAKISAQPNGIAVVVGKFEIGGRGTDAG